MAEFIRIHSYSHDAILEDFAAELVQFGGALNQIVTRIVRAGASSSTPGPALIAGLAESVVEEALRGVQTRYSRRDLKAATEIIADAAEAISENVRLAGCGVMEGRPADARAED